MELHKIYIDDVNKRVQVDLSGERDIIRDQHKEPGQYSLQAEYGRWMIESIT